MSKPDANVFESELLRALQGESSVDAEARGRVRQRLSASLAGAMLGAGSPPEPSAGLREVAGRLVTTGGARAIGLVSLGLGVGGVLGAAGHAWLAPSRTEVVYVDRYVAGPSASPSEPTPMPALAASARPATPIRAAQRHSPEPPPEPPSSSRTAPVGSAELGPDLALLELARRAVSARDFGKALGLLESHAERFPASALEQEREALTIKALVGAGRTDEARARGKTFEQRFPNSMLRDSVEKALGTIP